MDTEKALNHLFSKTNPMSVERGRTKKVFRLWRYRWKEGELTEDKKEEILILYGYRKTKPSQWEVFQ